MNGPDSSEVQPPLLLARSREEFELMEDELGTVAAFVGYFPSEAAFRAAVLTVESHGGQSDGNYWPDPRGVVYSLWEYHNLGSKRKEVRMKV